MGWHPLKAISVKHPARAMRCPYLGLYDNRSQALSELTSRHRCHMIAIHGNQARPERVGTSYRAQAACWSSPGHHDRPFLLLRGR